MSGRQPLRHHQKKKIADDPHKETRFLLPKIVVNENMPLVTVAVQLKRVQYVQIDLFHIF
jgi:hypothetical protein